MTVPMTDLPRPQERIRQIGRDDVEASLRRTIAAGAFSHGWIITGGVGAGKATLAYRIARGVLDAAALTSCANFDMDADSPTFRLIAQGAHPDIFVAERLWIEKTSKYQSEITVETIRRLIHFMNHTPAFGGARVAIIDTADDLNRNAANALLKVLEEPPANTLLLLLCSAPGRLLATIRSRCKRIDLRPVPRGDICALLESEGLASGGDADRIADHADGRPGYALRLAADGGAKALSLADAFVQAGCGRGDVSAVASNFSARTSAEEWAFFVSAVTSALSDGARVAGRGDALEGPLAGAAPSALVDAWERLSTLAARGDALNLDRAQIVSAMGHDMKQSLGVV